jgi:predicted nucleic acid-binding protein
MPKRAERFVLDTSALMTLMSNAPGADEVEAVLHQHGRRKAVFISFMSPMELAYVLEQKENLAAAHRGILRLKQLPLQIVESDEPLGLAAARIKAAHRMSVADAWIAATAARLGATLVHKDPEFLPLAGQIPLLTLPLK